MGGFSDQLKIYHKKLLMISLGVPKASSLIQKIFKSFDNQYLATGLPTEIPSRLLEYVFCRIFHKVCQYMSFG